MDVCKCIVPLQHVGTLNSRRAASPRVGWEEGEERWEVPDQPQGFLPLNWSGTEQNRTITSMVLKPNRLTQDGYIFLYAAREIIMFFGSGRQGHFGWTPLVYGIKRNHHRLRDGCSGQRVMHLAVL
ncbi:uncharacterized protein TNCV_3091021 [Trichonephila clavipes]|uniref:Uncharacterized protein n=1 Tax=Trichonephila clavipes TaxID=2585209 RepID=A0A8X7BG91_TRICX|nr:uncharacterized protein TNCV_3091021 [Trichonephila clavipes]